MGHQQFILPRKLHLPQGKMGPDQGGGGGGGERKQDMLQEMLSSATVFSNVSQLHKRHDRDKSGETSHWVPVLSSQTCCQDKRCCMSRLCHRGISSAPLLPQPGDAAPGDRQASIPSLGSEPVHPGRQQSSLQKVGSCPPTGRHRDGSRFLALASLPGAHLDSQWKRALLSLSVPFLSNKHRKNRIVFKWHKCLVPFDFN